MTSSQFRSRTYARSRICAWSLALGSLAFLGPAGCDDSKDAPAPELKKFLIIGPDMHETDLLVATDGGAPTVSPRSRIKLVFNQLLDGDKIESVTMTGVTGKAGVATAAWTGAAAGAPLIATTTTYSPGGSLGVDMPGPSVDLKVAPGLPSGAQIAVALARDRITGKKGLPFVGMTMFTFATQPFSAAVNVGDKPVSETAEVNLDFSNAAARDTAGHISVTTGGLPVMVEVKASMSAPHSFTLKPVQGGAWISGATYTVTIDKDVADVFGVKPESAITTTFTVSGGSDAGSMDAAVADVAAGDSGR